MTSAEAECKAREENVWFIFPSFLNLPSTFSCETASATPCSFLSFTLISPVSLLWHLLRSKRLCLADLSIFTVVSSSSSSPSLYQWILTGSWPTKCSLNVAFCPTLTVTDCVKASRASGLILGGSKKGHFIVYCIWYR